MTGLPSGAELAERHGLRRVSGRAEWRGDCPSCGYAAGLVVTEREGRTVWWCASCGGDRAALTATILGAGGAPSGGDDRTPTVDATAAARASRAAALWGEALPFDGSPAEHYLDHRGVLGAYRARADLARPALRFVPRCPHPAGRPYPSAMIALVRDAGTGEAVGVHRTFLIPGGEGKDAREPNKASLGPIAGGVVMLHRLVDGEALVIGEGVETALAASALMGLPAWAAVSAGNLARLVLPPLPALPAVVIAADPDRPGQEAAWQAADRWCAEGRDVRVATPDTPGADFNDVLCSRQRAAGAKHGA